MSPVLVLMLATIIESVRTPVRSAPASEPSSRTLTRGVPAQGSAMPLLGWAWFSPAALGATCLPLLNRLPMTSRWMVT